ncbi:unnamed protein product, partial [Enterobius vermicularis]|uniref:FA complementation group D2 n=1 Tax=Enterobius vermicularis TaxID=51028 RepID=A0A0N4VKE3_ENTVE
KECDSILDIRKKGSDAIKALVGGDARLNKKVCDESGTEKITDLANRCPSTASGGLLKGTGRLGRGGSLSTKIRRDVRTLGRRSNGNPKSVSVSKTKVPKRTRGSLCVGRLGANKSQDCDTVKLSRISEFVQPLSLKGKQKAKASFSLYAYRSVVFLFLQSCLYIEIFCHEFSFQAQPDVKNIETAVLSLLDDFLVKKVRLEDILIKFQEAQGIKELNSVNLAAYLVKYANDVNIGKVPWQSLITLIQKGKSLAGNLVELINQLCAENQWKDLGVEFYRQLCISFVRCNQVFVASRHLNVGCCLILTASALSMDSESVDTLSEVKTLLMELLRYTISSHPSESVVPLLCLASKFVPDFIKDFFYETKEDDKLFCDLISVHLSSKQDYLAIFKSLWKSSASQLLSLSVVDTERFHSMLSRKKEEVLNIVHGVDVERKEVLPPLKTAVSSFVSLYTIADVSLFPEKTDYALNFLSQSLSFFSGKEGLYSQANVSSSDRDVNALILCSYIIISLRTTQRLSSVFNLSLQNLATCAYQIHQNLDLGSSKMMRFGSFSEAAEFVSATGCFWLDPETGHFAAKSSDSNFLANFPEESCRFWKLQMDETEHWKIWMEYALKMQQKVDILLVVPEINQVALAYDTLIVSKH